MLLMQTWIWTLFVFAPLWVILFLIIICFTNLPPSGILWLSAKKKKKHQMNSKSHEGVFKILIAQCNLPFSVSKYHREPHSKELELLLLIKYLISRAKRFACDIILLLLNYIPARFHWFYLAQQS